MKKLLFVMLLVMVMAPYAVCQHGIAAKPLWNQKVVSPKPVWNEFKIKNMKLDFEERQNESHFRNEMRKFKLQKKKNEVRRPNLRRKRVNLGYRLLSVLKKKMVIFLVICIILHILFTVWVYNDLKARQVDGALWIFIVLLSGFWGALVYSLVRLGDIVDFSHQCCEKEEMESVKKKK
ncbi:hypothetical protein KAJ27_02825 [bacterium]|nr:hypothetical protein [bacterium]